MGRGEAVYVAETEDEPMVEVRSAERRLQCFQ